MLPKAIKSVMSQGNTLKDNSLVGSSEPQGRKIVDSLNEQFSPNATLDVLAKAEKELTRIAKNSIECIDLQDQGKLIDEFGKSIDREQLLYGIVGSFFNEIEKLLQDNIIQCSKIENLEKLLCEGSIREERSIKAHSSDLTRLRSEKVKLVNSPSLEQSNPLEKDDVVIENITFGNSRKSGFTKEDCVIDNSVLSSKDTCSNSPICTFCGKRNHFAIQCFARKKQIAKLYKELHLAINGKNGQVISTADSIPVRCQKSQKEAPLTRDEVSQINRETPWVLNQAVLGNRLSREIVKRCMVESPTEDTFGRKSSRSGPPIGCRIRSYPKWLLKHEEGWVTRLTNVRIFPSSGETEGLGTLEAHFNGFIFSVRGFSQVFMHDDVQTYFYEPGYVEPPLLQFHLKHPITVRNKETKDIQFFLEGTPPGEGFIRNNDLEEFVDKVPENQRTCRLAYESVYFEKLDDFKFFGDCPIVKRKGAPADCCLTYSALVVREGQPYYVVPLSDMMIVNLALIRLEVIEMTVVFKDLERDVLEISGIPWVYLNGIKSCLDETDVKFFVNSLSPNWRELVSEVRDHPEKFLAKGGWDSFEDMLTLSCYQHVYLDADMDEGKDIYI